MYCPCKDCNKKGCGSYHDQCDSYQKWIQDREEKKQEQKAREALDRIVGR